MKDTRVSPKCRFPEVDYLPDRLLQDFEALRRDAAARHAAGDLAHAKSLYRAHLVLEPAAADSLHLLGVVSYQEGLPKGAIRLITSAVAVKPGVSAYYSNLSLAWLEVADASSALRATKLAVVVDPGFGDAIVNHGAALRESRLHREAVCFGRRGVALRPALSAAQSSLGHSLYFRDRHHEAVAALERALLLSPGNAKALNVYGLCLAAIGDPEAARFLRRAWQLMPRHFSFFGSFAELHQFQQDDPWFAVLKNFEAQSTTLDARSRTQLYFTLAKAYQEMGEPAQSFAYLLQANQHQRQLVAYDEQATLAMLDRILEVFTPQLIADKAGAGDPSTLPIFIVGLPRSGSSLIEQILASHPAVFGSGEQPEFPRLLDFLDDTGQLAFPDSVRPASREMIAAIGRDYVSYLRQKHPTARYITDKMPGNLPFAGFIHLALPNARIIQVRRDPIDSCLSCFSKLFFESLNYTYDLGELGRFGYRYQLLMDHWEKILPDDCLLTVRYEDIIQNLEIETRRMLKFCDLPWDDAVLSFHQTKRAVMTASATQVRKPIYHSSVGRWRPDAEQLMPLLKGLRLNLPADLDGREC